jgi:hypothetical protein
MFVQLPITDFRLLIKALVWPVYRDACRFCFLTLDGGTLQCGQFCTCFPGPRSPCCSALSPYWVLVVSKRDLIMQDRWLVGLRCDLTVARHCNGSVKREKLLTAFYPPESPKQPPKTPEPRR